MHVYVFWRAASVPLIDRHGPQGLLIGSCVVLWTAFFLGRVFGHGGTGPLAAAIEFFGMSWMAVLFLLCISLLSLNLATGFGFLFQRQVASLRSEK